MITSYSNNTAFLLSLKSFAQLFKDIKHIRFFFDEVYPGKSGEVIHNNIGISFSTKAFNLHRPHQVPVQQLQDFRSGQKSRQWGGHSGLLSNLTLTTHPSFINMEFWYPSDSLHQDHLFHSSEMQMSKFLMTQLYLLFIFVCGAHRREVGVLRFPHVAVVF